MRYNDQSDAGRAPMLQVAGNIPYTFWTWKAITYCLKFFVLFNICDQMFLHAWRGYSEYAWGYNEVRPVSLQAHTGSVFGRYPLGATIVDAMDTLLVMGLTEEFEKGRQWIRDSLNMGQMASTETHNKLITGRWSDTSLLFYVLMLLLNGVQYHMFAYFSSHYFCSDIFEALSVIVLC